jgi:hypothetical protein
LGTAEQKEVEEHEEREKGKGREGGRETWRRKKKQAQRGQVS